jgi:hypothetical protein
MKRLKRVKSRFIQYLAKADEARIELYSLSTASIQMSLVWNLPKDLFNSLLLSWLGHVGAGRIDSAVCCTGQRAHF